MSFYAEHVLPRCLDLFMRGEDFAAVRSRATEGLAGTVVEVGFGSGMNLPFYPRSVTQILAVDPAVVGRKLARKRIAASGIPIEWSGLDGQKLALPDASADAMLCTFTLCTIPDAVAALREMHRVLKPGARLHFVEHGLSPEPNVAKWQHRLTPLQRKLFGGCHLDRPIDRMLREAGFCIDSLEHSHMPGPKPMTYLYEGRARACDCGGDEARAVARGARN
jgi:ubiquinone/menaquinone biosynthesis C-methylase UbiE